jgi:hypothetical protein
MKKSKSSIKPSAKSTRRAKKNPIVVFEKRAIRMARKNYFWAGAAASLTFVASAVGLGVYLLAKKQDSRKVAFQKMKIKVLREIENTGDKISDQIRKLNERR